MMLTFEEYMNNG